MLNKRKKSEILRRIETLETDIVKAREYLDTGAHSNWHKFRPLFTDKLKNGKPLPPHKGWVQNVFLPNLEKKLIEAEKLLDRAE